MSIRKIYRRLAEQEGVPLKTLKSDMQQAPHTVWHMTQSSGVREYQKSIPSHSVVQTPDEMILPSVYKVRS